MQRAGDEDFSELGDSFTLWQDKVQRPLPQCFCPNSKATHAQIKCKSCLRMVEGFDNTQEKQPAMKDGKDSKKNEIPWTESSMHKDDLPATSEEIHRLRQVAHVIPQIASEFTEEWRVPCLT